MSDYLISLDQGTTSTRAILYHTSGSKVAICSEKVKSNFPNEGWVEQNPNEILSSSIKVLKDVVELAKIDPKQIIGMGITNQRETTLVWNRKTGECIYPAIIWQDRRTAPVCQALKDKIDHALIQQKTGLLLDPYFCATKLKWILDNVSSAKRSASQGDLCFGTVDSYLLWHLSEEQAHLTDVTNASRTLLFNIQNLTWDEELIHLFEIPTSLLPEVKQNCANYGHLKPEILGQAIPILSLVGDQQAASIGQGCIKNQQAKATYGTGCFLLLNTGDQCVLSEHRLLTTIGYQVQQKLSYALEGSIFIAGALVSWLKNSLSLFEEEEHIEDMITNVSDQHAPIFVPALCGLGAPFWDPHSKGAIFGLTQETSIGHILKAGLQGICYQTRDLVESLHQDTHHPICSLKVDGGMANNKWFLQALADCLQLDIVQSKCTEATAFGAFLLAGIQAGVFLDLNSAIDKCEVSDLFEPKHDKNLAKQQYENWLEHIEKIKVNQ